MQKFNAPGLVALAKPGQLILLEGDTTREITSVEWLQAMAAGLAVAMQVVADTALPIVCSGASEFAPVFPLPPPATPPVAVQDRIGPPRASPRVLLTVPEDGTPLDTQNKAYQTQLARVMDKVRIGTNKGTCWYYNTTPASICRNACPQTRWTWLPGVCITVSVTVRRALYGHHIGKVPRRDLWLGSSCGDARCVNPGHSVFRITTTTGGSTVDSTSDTKATNKEFLRQLLSGRTLTRDAVFAAADLCKPPRNHLSLLATATELKVIRAYNESGVSVWTLPTAGAL